MSNPPSNNILVALKTLREFIAVQEARIDELSTHFQNTSSTTALLEPLQQFNNRLNTLECNLENLHAQSFPPNTYNHEIDPTQLIAIENRVRELTTFYHSLLDSDQEKIKQNQYINNNIAEIKEQLKFLEETYSQQATSLQLQHQDFDSLISRVQSIDKFTGLDDRLHILETRYSQIISLEQQTCLLNSSLAELRENILSSPATSPETEWVSLEQENVMLTFIENKQRNEPKIPEVEEVAPVVAQYDQTQSKKKPRNFWQIIKNYRPFKRKKKICEEQAKDYLKTPSEFVEEQMIGLYRSLSALLPNKRHWGRSIQFIASRSGEGASVICREFAKVLARRLDMSVLLVDADPQGEQLAHFDIQRSMGWNEAVFDNAPIQYALKQIADSKLFVTQMAMPGESITRIVHAPEIEAILEDLKRQFDFIVIDTLPGTVSVDGLTLSHKVDGVILIVEAECTRWQIVQQTKENIEIRGGNVLGVILNKRRFYIPKFIYDRLL